MWLDRYVFTYRINANSRNESICHFQVIQRSLVLPTNRNPYIRKFSFVNEDNLAKGSLKIYAKLTLLHPEILKRIHSSPYSYLFNWNKNHILYDEPTGIWWLMSRIKGCPVFSAVPTIPKIQPMATVLGTLSHVLKTLRKLYQMKKVQCITQPSKRAPAKGVPIPELGAGTWCNESLSPFESLLYVVFVGQRRSYWQKRDNWFNY